MPLSNEERHDSAIRLLKLFASAGQSSGVAIANSEVLDLATQNGLADQELLCGLGYAAEHNWLAVEQTGLSLTEAGNAAISGKVAA